MSDIALAVGAAVVKVATKVWLGAPFASSSTDAGIDTVTDVIQARVAGRREQRQVRRQFEHLEETVADRVLAVLGHEFAGVPSNEREAAVLAVADTFDAARLHDTELFAQDLDPLYLERHIRATTPIAVRDFSAGGVALFDRVLAECCTYVILLSTALPTFNSAAFTEILRRERTLIDKVDELLARVPGPEPSDGDRAGAEFATAYRRHIMARLDRLDLFGADVRTRRYPLTLAYVGLNARTAEAADMLRTPVRLGGATIEDTLAGSRRLLLRGNAGSGKTTLLQWLAVRAAGRDLPARLRTLDGCVPFLVRLREYVDRGLPSPNAFLHSSGRHLRYAMPEGWVEELLSSGNALVLIDGVDELPDRRRAAVRRWLRDLVEDFPNARYVVTSRPAAVSEGWLDDDGFTPAELAPMGHGQIRAFIEHWHAAVRSEIVDVEERERLDRYEERLRATVLSARHLRGLASTPLLCALLCALNRDRHARLPESRMEIYEAALAMLLERRDAEREVDDEMRLTGTQRRALLRELAHWLIRNELSDAEWNRAVAQIGRSLGQLPDLGASAEDVFQHLLERTGLLQAPAVDRVGFAHRTFEEYLAAEAFAASDDLEQLSQRAHKDQWQQVIVMAAGHTQGEQRERLFRALFERADAHETRRDRIHMVALAALETAVELPAPLRAEIMKRADPLLPPRTMKQAEAVAAGGPSALRVLASRKIKGKALAAATIRAATAIGGPDALDVIAACAEFDSDKVERELVSAWAQLDPESFAKRIWSGSGRSLLGLLPVSSDEQLHACAHIRGLGGLDCSVDLILENLGGLGPFEGIEALALNLDGKACDVSVLRRFTSLSRLYFQQAPADFEVAPVLPPQSLRVFAMWAYGNPLSIASLAEIPQLAELQHLVLTTDRLDSLEGVQRWQGTLTHLWVYDNPLVDLTPLQSLRELEFIDIQGIRVTDLRPLKGFRGLTVSVRKGQQVIGEELLGKDSRVIRE